MDAITALRLRLLANGFTPLPCKGKRPVIRNWQNVIVTSEMVQSWETLYPDARNTGVRCAAIDVDVTDPGGAKTTSESTGGWFDGNGIVLTRTGNAPKFLVPVRGEITQRKIFVLRDPSGKRHQIEIRPANSQFICDGPHPDTHEPYSWHAGRSLETIRYDELPLTSDENLQQWAKYTCDSLHENNNYTTEQALAAGTDDRGRGDDGKFDPFVALRTMHPSSAGAAETQKSAVISLVARAFHPIEIQKIVVDETMKIAEAANLGWTRAVEEKEVAARLRWAVNVKCHDHDPAIEGDIPPWLNADFHEAWLRVHEQGGRPQLTRNPSGWYVRGPRGPDEKERRTKQTDEKAAGEQPGNDANKTLRANKRDFVLRPFVRFDPALLPPRQWLYGRHYQRSTVSATIAPGGFGKTTLNMVEAIAMATCRNLLGEQPTERLRVWFHNGEDSFEELMRRIAAVCQHFNIPMEELEGWLFVTSGNEVPLRVASGYSELRIDHALIAQINKNIEQNKIDLAVFDPLITLHGVPEQDNTKMDHVIRIFAAIADTRNCAIELAHHTRKMPAGNAGDYGGADMRGASATHDAVRSVRALNRMSEKDAQDLNIPDHERVSYFRVDKAKGNNSPAAKAVWRQFLNVDLANGDEVGVLVTWNYPGQGPGSAETAEGERAAEHVFMTLLGRYILQGRNASDRPGKNYAPLLFAKEKEAKVAKANRIMLENAMRRLFDTGRIRVVKEGSSGHARHRIVSTEYAG
jgi:hypothetical protein